jgi:hypothetical protein
VTRSGFWPRCRAGLSVVFDGRGGGDSSPLLVEAAPRAATVSRNGIHDADTWSLDFDLRALPFDPDFVRSIAVVIYMWNADDATDDGREWAVPEYEMIRGLADDAGFKLDDRTFHMEGRDYTGLLIDVEWDAKKRVPSGGLLTETIQAIADAAAPPNTRARFEVEWGSLDPVPRVGAARRSTKRKGLWVKPGTTTWEVIYNMAISHGYVARVVGQEIRITDLRIQTRESVQSAARLIYGRTLETLDVNRKLTRERVPQVRVTAYDAAAGKAIEVLYPAKGDTVTTGLGTKRNEVTTLPAPPGITDRDTLKRYARARYADMARSEAVYKASTFHLVSGDEFDGESDLLRLDNADPIAIKYDAWNRELLRQLSEEQRVEHLMALGYSESVSATIASHLELADQFRQPYYIRSATFDFDVDQGIEISVAAVNYAYESRNRAIEVAS